MRVLVCGGRDYGNIKKVFETLDAHVVEDALIIHGGAFGADRISQVWADNRGHCCMVYPAKWQEHGKAAGPIRNQEMINEGKPDLCIAFPGGRGTADMVKRAKAAGIKVIEVEPKP